MSDFADDLDAIALKDIGGTTLAMQGNGSRR
jgi:hypothetical protein